MIRQLPFDAVALPDIENRLTQKDTPKIDQFVNTQLALAEKLHKEFSSLPEDVRQSDPTTYGRAKEAILYARTGRADPRKSD
jgi:hypothetical protein